MAAATGLTGKMSVQAITKVTDLNIRITMRMESGSHRGTSIQSSDKAEKIDVPLIEKIYYI